MKIEIVLCGGSERFSRLEVIIDGKTAGELIIGDENVPNFLYKLLGECRITTLNSVKNENLAFSIS